MGGVSFVLLVMSFSLTWTLSVCCCVISDSKLAFRKFTEFGSLPKKGKKTTAENVENVFLMSSLLMRPGTSHCLMGMRKTRTSILTQPKQ